MKIGFPVILLSLIFSGCCTQQPAEIPLPNCDQPVPVDGQVWNDLDLMRETMSMNALLYQECLQRNKQRIVNFNES